MPRGSQHSVLDGLGLIDGLLLQNFDHGLLFGQLRFQIFNPVHSTKHVELSKALQLVILQHGLSRSLSYTLSMRKTKHECSTLFYEAILDFCYADGRINFIII